MDWELSITRSFVYNYSIVLSHFLDVQIRLAVDQMGDTEYAQLSHLVPTSILFLLFNSVYIQVCTI